MSGPSKHLSWKELDCKDGTFYPIEFIQDKYKTMKYSDIGNILGKNEKAVVNKVAQLQLRKFEKISVGDKIGKLEVILVNGSISRCRCKCGEEFKAKTHRLRLGRDF